MKANVQPGGPIINAWISSEPDVGYSGNYAFVEFRTVEEANRGFCLSNITLLGNQLKVGKPRIATNTAMPSTPVLNELANKANIAMKSIHVNQR